MTSLLQPEFTFYGRGLEGSGASRLYGPGDGATRTAHGQPAGSSLPPALEAPSRVTTTPPVHAEASEPGPSGPKGPILDTLTGTNRSGLLGAQGQRLFPVVPGQASFDGTLVAPRVEGPQNAPDAPEAPRDTLTAPLPLPEPWHDGQQLRLDAAYVPPAGPWRGTLGEYVEALAATWASVVAWMQANGADPRDLAFAQRRAREVPNCGDTWQAPVGECGYVDDAKAILIEGCDSRTCPRCARIKAQHYRKAGFAFVKAHPVERKKGKVSRGFFLTTLTEPKPDVLSLAGFVDQVGAVKKAGSAVHRKVGRFLPRQRDGAFGAYPGKCADAGQIVAVECGPLGNVHAHVWRYGAWHYSEDVREAAGGHWTHDTKVRPDEKGARGSVVEALKYAVKSSTKPGRREFLHPAVAVLFELATRGRRLIEGYGTMRGLVKQAEDADIEERQGVMMDDAERIAALATAPCPHCGKVHGWTFQNITRPRTWVPSSWDRRRAQPPPGG
jgi:hypothetical protein